MVKLVHWVLFSLIFVFSACSVFAVSNVQYSVAGNVVTLTYQGSPPFWINIRGDATIGQKGGYLWAKTYSNSFSYDLSFAKSTSGKFYYGVKDLAWSATDNFSLFSVPVCSDGTAFGSCSINKPGYCNAQGQLVNDCNTCGCPSPLGCVNGQCTSTSSACIDGTKFGTCSLNKPKYCTPEGNLLEDCNKCGCPSPLSCIDNQCKTSGPPCYEGTPAGTCSQQKPEYCTPQGQIIMDCNTCGCPNLLSCISNQCVKNIVSQPVYDCTFCHGVCYTQDSNTNSICTDDGKYFSWPKDAYPTGKSCQQDSDCNTGTPYFQRCIKNYCLTDMRDHPWGLPIYVKTIYPRSVQKGQSIQITVNVKNLDINPIQIRIRDVYATKFIECDSSEDRSIAYAVTKTISANSEANFVMDISPFTSVSTTSRVEYYLSSNRAMPDIAAWGYDIPFDTTRTGPIIVYDSTLPLLTCGGITYTKGQAVCKDNILYPTKTYQACSSNADCPGSSTVCLNYNCVSPSSPTFMLNELHTVGIVPIFVYEQTTWYDSEKNKRVPELTQLASLATNWFNQERVFQNAQNNFNVRYAFYKTCAFTKSEYISLLKTCVSSNWPKCQDKTIAACGITMPPSAYNMIATTGYYEPGMDLTAVFAEANRIGMFGVSGMNFGKSLSFGLTDDAGIKDMGVLIHETLHSFGEEDLYMENGAHNEFYQERNCNLFRANLVLFKIVPHLCDFEAKMIGWKT